MLARRHESGRRALCVAVVTSQTLSSRLPALTNRRLILVAQLRCTFLLALVRVALIGTHLSSDYPTIDPRSPDPRPRHGRRSWGILVL